MVLAKRVLEKLDNSIIQCTRRNFNKENSATAFVCNFAISKKLEITNWKEKIWFTIVLSVVIDNLRTSNRDTNLDLIA